MAHSMTGYGVGHAAADGLSIAVELRSVNNRFLDFHIRTPRALYPHEPDIRKLIGSRVSRGRVSVHVGEEWTDDSGPEIRIDRARVRQYVEQLRRIQGELDLGGEVRLEHLLSVDNIFIPGDDETYRQHLWELTRTALNEALDALVASAEREGEILCADISERIGKLQHMLADVKGFAAVQVEGYRDRLTTRLEELLSDERLDHNRLENEIALAADRLDITEEIVRLESHLSLLENTITGKSPIGKTLGFVLQELGREANTIASKSWSIDISQTAIQMKEILEQVREQIQNIE